MLVVVIAAVLLLVLVWFWVLCGRGGCGLPFKAASPASLLFGGCCDCVALGGFWYSGFLWVCLVYVCLISAVGGWYIVAAILVGFGFLVVVLFGFWLVGLWFMWFRVWVICV